jgi:arylsulfatase B
MKAAGYRTHLAGKTDGFGIATPQHLPTSPLRGFDSALGYFNHANDNWNYTIGFGTIGQVNPCIAYRGPTGTIGGQMIDFYYNEGSIKATKYYNCTNYANPNQSCVIADEVFANRIIDVIQDSKSSHQPFFAWYSSHMTHTPLQVSFSKQKPPKSN